MMTTWPPGCCTLGVAVVGLTRPRVSLGVKP